MSLREGLPPEKQGQKIDLTIAHWCIWGPGRSGMYETVKELIMEEMEMNGVLAGMVNPEQGAEKGGQTDGWITTQSHGWAWEQANVHVSHYFMSGYSLRQKPRVFMIHGTPEACLENEEKSGSFSACADAFDKYEAVITMYRRHEWFWKQFDKSGKIYYVPKGVDIRRRWTPKGMKMDLDGEPKILYGEVWRSGGVKDPMLTFYAVDEYYRNNEDARLHCWGVEENRQFLYRTVIQGGFRRFLGRYELAGRQLFPEQWYRAGDILISPVLMGEPSRVQKEALGCGTPVIVWDTDPFPDNYAFYKAKPFDTSDMAECIAKLWDDIKADPQGMRAKARQIAENHYDIKIMARKVVDILRMVVNKS